MPPTADDYRCKALELCARADEQRDPALRVEYENLAFLYMELADKVESTSVPQQVGERGTASGRPR